MTSPGLAWTGGPGLVNYEAEGGWDSGGGGLGGTGGVNEVVLGMGDGEGDMVRTSWEAGVDLDSAGELAAVDPSSAQS
jgi:hypothetical protein